MQGTGTQSSNGASSGSTLDISGLNKEGTQQQINSKLATANDTLNTIKNQQCGQDVNHPCSISPDGETSNAPQSLTDKNNEYEAKFQTELGKLSDWSVIPTIPTPTIGIHPASCSSLQASFYNNSVVFDACQYQPAIKEVLAWVLYILTSGVLFSMFFRSPYMRP